MIVDRTLLRRLTAACPSLRTGLKSLSIACLLGSLGGCIENPGPDPLLGVPKPESVIISASFGNEVVLNLAVVRDSGRTTLRVTNVGSSPIDSAEFQLEITNGWDTPYYDFNRMVPDSEHSEFHRKVRALSRGESQDMGILDISIAGDLADRKFSATLIRIHRTGDARKGNSFAGVFRGTYETLDTSGFSKSGDLRGIIDADGRARFGLFSSEGDAVVGSLRGTILENGELSSRGWIGYIWPWNTANGTPATGAMAPREKGYSASYLFPKNLSNRFAKLDFLMEYHSP